MNLFLTKKEKEEAKRNFLAIYERNYNRSGVPYGGYISSRSVESGKIAFKKNLYYRMLSAAYIVVPALIIIIFYYYYFALPPEVIIAPIALSVIVIRVFQTVLQRKTLAKLTESEIKEINMKINSKIEESCKSWVFGPITKTQILVLTALFLAVFLFALVS